MPCFSFTLDLAGDARGGFLFRLSYRQTEKPLKANAKLFGVLGPARPLILQPLKFISLSIETVYLEVEPELARHFVH